MGNPSRRYTAEFKQKAVELYRKSDTTNTEVARGLGCDPGSLADRVKKAGARCQPVPDGRGPAQAEEGKRAAQTRKRDTFKSERLLRQQAAAGLSAKRAKFTFIFSSESNWPVSEMCAPLEAARLGYYAWRSRPPSATRSLPSRYPRSGTRFGASTASRRRSSGCGLRRAHLAQARGPHHARARLARRHARVRQAPSGEKRASKRESAQDLAGHRFEAGDPNAAWFAEIIYVKTRQGWLYLRS